MTDATPSTAVEAEGTADDTAAPEAAADAATEDAEGAEPAEAADDPAPASDAADEAVLEASADAGDAMVEGEDALEEVEMDDEAVQAHMRSSITRMLTDPDAGDLSLAVVKQRLKDELGKKAVKQHKDVSAHTHTPRRTSAQTLSSDLFSGCGLRPHCSPLRLFAFLTCSSPRSLCQFIRDFVKEEVLRQQAEQGEGDGEAAEDAADADAPPADDAEAAAEDADDRPRRPKPRRRASPTDEVDARDADDEDYQEGTGGGGARKKRIPLKAGKQGPGRGVGKKAGPTCQPRSAYHHVQPGDEGGSEAGGSRQATFGEVSKHHRRAVEGAGRGGEGPSGGTRVTGTRSATQTEMERAAGDRRPRPLRGGAARREGAKGRRRRPATTTAEDGDDERPKKKRKDGRRGQTVTAATTATRAPKELGYFDSDRGQASSRRRQTKSHVRRGRL